MKDLYEYLTITIVIYKENFELISKCLDQIKNFKIIIVDNGADVNLKKKIQSEYKISEYILNDKNLGFSKGINQAIKISGTEFILNLEADCVINEKNIFKLYEAINFYQNCAMTIPTMFDENNRLTQSGGLLMEKNLGYDVLNFDGDVCVDFPSTAAVLFRRKEILNLGLFDEDLFIYYPDSEIGRRIKKNKRSIIQIFNSKAIHVMGTLKIKNNLKNVFYRNYYFTIDGLVYYFKENLHLSHLEKLKKKLPNLLMRSILNIILFRFSKSVECISKIIAYYNFKKKFLKKR